MIKSCTIIYFSPTGTTKKVVKIIADDVAKHLPIHSEPNKGIPYRELDITNPIKDLKETDFTFGKDDFVIIGIPVYSGRVPKLAKKALLSLRGNHTPAALIATFGNRHYDDSLLELKTLVESHGFLVVAAGAFVTEHTVVQKFGAGRPNDEDIRKIHQFANHLANKLHSWNPSNHSDLSIKGNPTYRRYKSIPITPHTIRSQCVTCGACAKQCPAKAISMEHPQKTDRKKCVTCMRCVRRCPQKARSLHKYEEFIAEKSIAKLCRDYKYPEIFI
ncbi:MAG: EFR1 family ferrodoxin [Peptococcaceae bacterium]|nr:EFR1 family ferrodoxin [Peptococcaceae bacterium]